jgi:TM2 domain-containing membrane protein YozV
LRLFIAIVLSLLIPGLGQYVNGQRWKGLAFIGLTLVGIVLENTVLVMFPYIVTLLTLVSIIDAILMGLKIRRGQREAPKGTRFVVEIIVLTVVSLLVALVVDEWTIQYIPNPFEELQNLAEPSEEEKKKVKEEAEQYLKDRYGEEFYVDNLHYTWQTDRWSMRGHLKNEEGWDFYVSKQGDQFMDTYFTHRISRDAEEEFKPIIEEAFDSLINWQTSVIAEDEVEDKYAKSIPSYQELRKETRKYRQIIRIALATSLTEKNQELELEKVFRLVSYLNQNHIRAELEIFYYDPAIKNNGIKKVDFTRRIQYEKFLTGKIEIYDVTSQVKTKGDLKKYLRIVDK